MFLLSYIFFPAKSKIPMQLWSNTEGYKSEAFYSTISTLPGKSVECEGLTVVSR